MLRMTRIYPILDEPTLFMLENHTLRAIAGNTSRIKIFLIL